MNDTATLLISLGSGARAFVPEEAAVTGYAIAAEGPGGLRQTAHSTSPSFELEIAPGEWKISVEGLSAGGASVVAGSLLVFLSPGERRSATIVLLPLGGPGNLRLAWSTVGDPGTDCRITGNLVGPSGETIPLDGAGASGQLVLTGLEAGTWALGLQLAAASGPLCGLAESILVVAGFETDAALLFEPPVARLSLILLGPSLAAETASLLPLTRRVPVGGSALFRVASGETGGLWCREGEALEAKGAELVLESLREGKERVDWLSLEPFSARSGSAALVGEPPLAFGPLRWKESLFRLDQGALPAAKSLDGCRSLLFSADGAYLYLAGREGNAVGSFELGAAASPFGTDAVDASEAAALGLPSRLALLPDGTGILVLAEASSSLLRIDSSASGALVPAASLSHPGLASSRGLVLDPAGGDAYLPSEDGDSIIRVRLLPGSLDASVAAQAGQTGLELFDRPTSIALGPDGSLLVVGSSGDDALYFFSRGADGELSLSRRLPKEDFSSLASLSDPVDLAFSPDGGSLFVLSYYGKALIRLDRDAGGAYLPVAAAKSGSGGISGFDYPKDLALSPDGAQLFVAGGGAADGLAAFEVSAPGSLSWLGVLLPDGSDSRPSRPSALAFSPDGRLLAVSSAEEDRLFLFEAAP